MEKATKLKSLRLKYQEYHQMIIEKLNALHQDMIENQKEVRLFEKNLDTIKARHLSGRKNQKG